MNPRLKRLPYLAVALLAGACLALAAVILAQATAVQARQPGATDTPISHPLFLSAAHTESHLAQALEVAEHVLRSL